jgi:hypothetical protein
MRGEKKVQEKKEISSIMSIYIIYMLIEHALLPHSISTKYMQFLDNNSKV